MNEITTTTAANTEAERGSARRIVVATEGGIAGTVAVRFAVAEARRRGTELQIVHVVPAYLPTGPLPMIPEGAIQQDSRDIMDRAVQVAEEADPDLELAPTMAIGGRVESIVRESADAELAVLGRSPGSILHRVWTGATAAGVAARATKPVVVVPPSWDPDEHTHGRVIVGIKAPSHVYALLARAFEEASATGSELVVMHAWRLTGVYDEMIANRVDRQQWHEQTEKVVSDLLVDLRRDYPWVHVRVDVVHAQPAHALVEASRTADRVFLSRPLHGGYVHHLGATARAVLRESHCPVEVVPPSRGDDAS